MNLLEEFKHNIEQEHLFHRNDKLLLAVSGGVDSVVLCELCKQAGYDFVIAHCNFQLRGAESERDEHFVKDLGKHYAVEVLVKIFDTNAYAEENKLSIQVAARELRYNWFNKILQELKMVWKKGSLNEHPTNVFLLTAHHANDNMETLLMNFFKGTGISGLHGILPKQGSIIRPLLFAKKEDIAAFAAENKLAFVEDSSNASDKYTRNYFRNQLIPDLQKVFPQVEENIIHNTERFREIEILYRQSVDLAKQKLMEPRGNEMHIPVLKLQKTPALNTIVYEIIKDYGFTALQTGDCIALLKSDSGKYIRSATHRIIRNRKWLIISPIETAAAANILIEEEGEVEFAAGKLNLKKIFNTQFSILNDPLTAQLDADHVKFPLLLRKWKQGDYFYPLGMKKKKKISRFLIDQKLSLAQKEKIWVIEMDRKIIWVIGQRIDDRCKITEKTNNVLQINYLP